MLRRALALVLVLGAAIAVFLWWRARPSRAEQLGAQAATPAQARLWQEVARRGVSSRGLDRLPIATAVDVRQAPTPLSGGQIAPGRGSIAPGVNSGIRVISRATRPGAKPTALPFAGMARVDDVSGDRIALNLGDLTLVVGARLGGVALSLAKGDNVQLAFESRAGVFARREILAMQTATGALVASALETGRTPVKMAIGPPLNLTAWQKDDEQPAGGALRVNVRIGKTDVVIAPGDMPQSVEGVFVKLVGSVALPVSGAADASPYAIDLIAWRLPGK